MFKKIIFSFVTLTLMSSQAAFAFQPKEIATYFNGPSVTAITASSANVFLASPVLAGLTEEEKSGVYFEYKETQLMCIEIYPTPEYCLPKKTEVGKTSATLSNLKAETSYTVTYKKNNTINCITTPCPENGFESLSLEFKTKATDGSVSDPSAGQDGSVPLTKYLNFGSRGSEVMALQNMLIKRGYLRAQATGYFGSLTFKAVKDFQAAHNIAAIGLVGPRTRAMFNSMMDMRGAEMFEGAITAYSTACFADGICSVTVGDKKIVTTRGWSQEVVGQVTGIPDFGSIENVVGSHAKVYAKKTDDGYTLYGSTEYYIRITPIFNSKLPSGSAPVGDASALKGTTWSWQKTVMSDGSVVTPQVADKFTITLGADGNLSGTTDCNGFFGGYSLGSDGVLKFGPLASTMMFCDGSQEQVFVAAVQKVVSYSAGTTGSLMLSLTNNEGTIYFVKK